MKKSRNKAVGRGMSVSEIALLIATTCSIVSFVVFSVRDILQGRYEEASPELISKARENHCVSEILKKTSVKILVRDLEDMTEYCNSK